jgi:hypothetical protein
MGVGFKIGFGGRDPPRLCITHFKPRFGGAFFALRKRTRAGLRQMTAFKGQLTHPRLWAKIPMPSSRKKRKEKFPV